MKIEFQLQMRVIVLQLKYQDLLHLLLALQYLIHQHHSSILDLEHITNKVEWDKKPYLMETSEKYKERQHKSMVIQPKTIPPSIPMKKAPPNTFSGRGKDIPGPSNYNPNMDTVKSRHRIADFAKLNKKREVFSNLPVENPGPGVYEFKNDISNKTVTTFNASGQSPMFLSKVPNCKDTKDDNGIPGPGSYIDKGKKKSVHQRSSSYKIEPNGIGFMTSTKREGYWDNILEAPFTKGTNIVNVPGPGKYQSVKKSKNKDKYNEIQNSKPGFSSTGDRECLKKNGKVQSPGPGQYIDINSPHFIAAQNIQK